MQRPRLSVLANSATAPVLVRSPNFSSGLQLAGTLNSCQQLDVSHGPTCRGDVLQGRFAALVLGIVVCVPRRRQRRPRSSGLARQAVPRRHLLGAGVSSSSVLWASRPAVAKRPRRYLWHVDGERQSEVRETDGTFPISSLKDYDIAILGEHHNQRADHMMEADFVTAFAAAKGPGNAALGLEMVEQPFQPVLDRFNRGELAVKDLYDATEWSKRWVWNFEDYAPVFEAARANKMPLVALNMATETLASVPLQGLPALTQEERAFYLPDSAGFAGSLLLPGFLEYSQQVIMASYDVHRGAGWLGSRSIDEATPMNFLMARLVRDEAMATAAWRYLDGPDVAPHWGKDAAAPQSKLPKPSSMVILVGCDHLKFGYGLGQRLRRLLSGIDRYEVLVNGLNIRQRPEPDAKIATVLMRGEMFDAAGLPVDLGQGRQYAKLADGRGYALLQAPDGRQLIKRFGSRPLKVGTVMLNPTVFDTLSDGPGLQLALPLTDMQKDQWLKLSDYIWSDTETPRTMISSL